MYHTQITAQGVYNTFRHKILEVKYDGTFPDVYHVSRAILQPSNKPEWLAVNVYYHCNDKSQHTVMLFTEEYLLKLLNYHTATSKFAGVGNITMKLYNDYE